MAPTGHSARDVTRTGTGRSADYPSRGFEADERRRLDRPHSPHSWPLCRSPLPHAVRNGPTTAEMVCRVVSEPVAVPLVCALEYGLAARAAFLSLHGRTFRSTRGTDPILVAGIYRVCCPVWSLRLEGLPSRNCRCSAAGRVGDRAIPDPCRIFPVRPSAGLGTDPVVAIAVGVRLRSTSGNDEPDVYGHRCDPLPLDPPARHLPVDVHPVF